MNKMTKILDLIESIESGNSIKIHETFETIIAQKLKERLEEMKSAVAKNIFSEAADRAHDVPQEPMRLGVEPADVKSASMDIKKKKTSNPDITVNEVLDPDSPAAEWIHDFVHSKDPKFAGKSAKERQQMALGAWYAAQRKKKGD